MYFDAHVEVNVVFFSLKPQVFYAKSFLSLIKLCFIMLYFVMMVY